MILVWSVVRYKYCDKFGLDVISSNPQYISALIGYTADKWEVPAKHVTINKPLGQGAFGLVYEGKVKDPLGYKGLIKCAVKTFKNAENADIQTRRKFLLEASVMK